jgi:hypothetical protein
MPVIALIAPKNSEDPGEAAILSEIASLPDTLRWEIQARCPTFKLKQSKMAGFAYYANTCPKCGVLSGDHYLHSDPGSPFFPADEADAAKLTIEELPLSGPVELDAGCHFGLGEIILKHAPMRISI